MMQMHAMLSRKPSHFAFTSFAISFLGSLLILAGCMKSPGRPVKVEIVDNVHTEEFNACAREIPVDKEIVIGADEKHPSLAQGKICVWSERVSAPPVLIDNADQQEVLQLQQLQQLQQSKYEEMDFPSFGFYLRRQTLQFNPQKTPWTGPRKNISPLQWGKSNTASSGMTDRSGNASSGSGAQQLTNQPQFQNQQQSQQQERFNDPAGQDQRQQQMQRNEFDGRFLTPPQPSPQDVAPAQPDLVDPGYNYDQGLQYNSNFEDSFFQSQTSEGSQEENLYSGTLNLNEKELSSYSSRSLNSKTNSMQKPKTKFQMPNTNEMFFATVSMRINLVNPKNIKLDIENEMANLKQVNEIIQNHCVPKIEKIWNSSHSPFQLALEVSVQFPAEEIKKSVDLKPGDQGLFWARIKNRDNIYGVYKHSPRQVVDLIKLDNASKTSSGYALRLWPMHSQLNLQQIELCRASTKTGDSSQQGQTEQQSGKMDEGDSPIHVPRQVLIKQKHYQNCVEPQTEPICQSLARVTGYALGLGSLYQKHKSLHQQNSANLCEIQPDNPDIPTPPAAQAEPASESGKTDVQLQKGKQKNVDNRRGSQETQISALLQGYKFQAQSKNSFWDAVRINSSTMSQVVCPK